ncbi:MAG: sulfatase [Rikenellaceae bacterium]
MKPNYKLTKLTALCGAAAVAAASCAEERPQPNILFVMADDHTSQAIGVYNSILSPLNPTPVIDQVAREGVVFENCFCTNGISTPSRACIISGQYSQTNGALDLYDTLDMRKQYLPRELKALGYETAMVGKWHLKSEPVGFDFYEVLPLQGKYFNPTFRVRGDKAWEKNTTSYKGHVSDIVTDISLNWLKNRDKTKPFFLMHHFKAPHDNFEYAPRYESYLADVDIPEPTTLYGQPAEGYGSEATRGRNDSLIHLIGSSISKRNHDRNMGAVLKVDQSLEGDAYTHASYQKYLKAYLRCVKGVDDNLARIIQYLKDEGVYDNTIIVYTGDQGLFLGEHDYQDKRWMYDPSMRMPFIVRYPESIKAGSRTDLLINNTDFAPTLIEMAGGKTPDYMQGKSFAKQMQGLSDEELREATYYRYWMHMASKHCNPAHFGVRTKRYKLIFFYGVDYVPGGRNLWGGRNGLITPSAWEFYDMERDPQELKNEYKNPKYAKIIADLKQEILRQRKELNEEDTKYPHIQKIINENWNK